MPFAKTRKRFTKGKRKGQRVYTGPSGRKFNYAQVKLYYSRGGTFKRTKRRGRKK